MSSRRGRNGSRMYKILQKYRDNNEMSFFLFWTNSAPLTSMNQSNTNKFPMPSFVTICRLMNKIFNCNNKEQYFVLAKRLNT